jgi:hypothetical protein
VTAREFALTLDEARQLGLLYAAYEPAKLEREELRWFRRWLDEGKGASSGGRPAGAGLPVSREQRDLCVAIP